MQRGFVGVGGAQGSLHAASNSAPAAADWDGDFDPDLVVGGSDGQLVFYRNDGSPTVANFVQDSTAGVPLAGLWAFAAEVDPSLGTVPAALASSRASGSGMREMAVRTCLVRRSRVSLGPPTVE